MNRNNTVVVLGEILLRFSVPDYKRIVQSNMLEIHVGGAEANVAVALKNFGLNSRILSSLPDNELGQLAMNQLRGMGVDTAFVHRSKGNMGFYFWENGSWARPSKSIYARENSTMCHAHSEDFDFESIFEDAGWFHTSGITPAISDEAAELTSAAIRFAKKKNITTSFDINFRQSLWTKQKAAYWLTKLCEYADVYIGNVGHAALLMDVDTSDLTRYKEVFKQLQTRFGFRYIACTIRVPHSASKNDFGAIVFDGENVYETHKYSVSIIDRVGSGDAFSAGLIYGLVNGKTLAESADFGAAAGALKHTIPGDQCHLAVEEVTALLQGDTSGVAKR